MINMRDGTFTDQTVRRGGTTGRLGTLAGLGG
jgi:hypothetical protein